ncbi:putative aminopeptidase W07G4.4 [Portunus trituberculatus]|uniref:Putative aminopeptidase W07G4.4 n=1 Tax=Portunus trituberculatus TaxID=210409 RepID=A0A5B7J619_PORTR|nr:putative aminopeptidase W07G4.4 [Portunus trituberculatus]
MTIATLTGHCCLAYGNSYSAVMDNGPASQASIARTIQAAGEEVADPLEVSTIRREDYEFHVGKSEYEDVLQSNNKPSTQTPRGHQSPSAFLVLASGLDKVGDYFYSYPGIDIGFNKIFLRHFHAVWSKYYVIMLY